MKIDNIRNSILNYPENYAFFIQGNYFSYRDLGEKITNIKNAFLSVAQGTVPKYIGVMINDDIESYASCISVLLAGYGYVPLNPLNPIERNLEIIRQADVKLLLTSKKINEESLKRDNSFIIINTSDLSGDNIDLSFPNSINDDPAYVIFTSGSTGKSKGAPISRQNLNAFLDSVSSLGWDINENDKFLQMSSMTFDMSILTFIIPLCIGACVYTVPEEEIKYLYGFRLMEEHNITFIAVVPSTLSYLKPYFSEISLTSIKYSLVCGEAFSIDLANQWTECVPNANIINIYGPTESTVFTHSYHYKKGIREKSYNGIMALGELVKNMETLILDEQGNDVAMGSKGELCISGKQLTNGYLNNPEKNQENFFTKNILGSLKRFYHTGDIVFIDYENCYFYSGRKDYQVKIQGHRVELGDIEKHSRDIIHSENTIAVAHKNEFGNYQIHLFTDNDKISREEIIKYLKSKLPYYMIPSSVSILRNLPMNANGKIDRIALTSMVK